MMDEKQERERVPLETFFFFLFSAPMDRDKYSSRRTTGVWCCHGPCPCPLYCPRVHECDTVAVYVFRIQENTRIQNTRTRLRTQRTGRQSESATLRVHTQSQAHPGSRSKITVHLARAQALDRIVPLWRSIASPFFSAVLFRYR